MKRYLPLLLMICITNRLSAADNVKFYQQSPAIATIPIEKTPMFVSIGWDDNGHADGMEWFLDFTDNLLNKDGTPVRTTYFITAGFGHPDYIPDGDFQTTTDVRNAWKHIRSSGNEIGNHSWNHPHGSSLTLEQWKDDQMGKCIDSLNTWIGIPKDSIFGFRTPYLEYNGPATLGAVAALGMFYDCSVEWGFNGFAPEEANGDPDAPSSTSGVYWNSATSIRTHKKLFWPYTLDNDAPPGNSAKGSVKFPGMWEFMVYTLLKTDHSGVITGFDYNTWAVLSASEWLAMMKHNFDLHRSQGNDGDDLIGNKAPFIINAHTDYYSEYNSSANSTFTKSTWQERREAMEDLVNYIISFPDSKIVPMVKIIDWMKNPVEIGGTKIMDKSSLLKLKTVKLNRISDQKYSISIPSTGFYDISIYDLSGRKLHSVSKGLLNSGNFTVDMTQSSIARGMLVLKVSGAVSASYKIFN